MQKILQEGDFNNFKFELSGGRCWTWSHETCQSTLCVLKDTMIFDTKVLNELFYESLMTCTLDGRKGRLWNCPQLPDGSCNMLVITVLENQWNGKAIEFIAEEAVGPGVEV